MNEMPDAVLRFWKGVDTHNWELVASAIAPDFVRVGMKDNEADTCRGKDDYLRFVSGVIGKFSKHNLESRSGYVSADGRKVTHEAIETIQPPGSDPIRMRFINIMAINEEGLISTLDIFWKTPPQMPPSWIEVDSVLSER